MSSQEENKPSAVRSGGAAYLVRPRFEEWGIEDAGHEFSDGSYSDPYVEIMVRELHKIIKYSDADDFTRRTNFHKAIWFLTKYGVSERELGQLFSVSPSSVNRWVNGQSSPTVMIRRIAVKAALDILKRDGLLIAGERYDPVTGHQLTKIPQPEDGR